MLKQFVRSGSSTSVAHEVKLRTSSALNPVHAAFLYFWLNQLLVSTLTSIELSCCYAAVTSLRSPLDDATLDLYRSLAPLGPVVVVRLVCVALDCQMSMHVPVYDAVLQLSKNTNS